MILCVLKTLETLGSVSKDNDAWHSCVLLLLFLFLSPSTADNSHIFTVELFAAWLLSHLSGQLYHQGTEQKARSLPHVHTFLVFLFFSLAASRADFLFPSLLIFRMDLRGLKLHLFQLANDLF